MSTTSGLHSLDLIDAIYSGISQEAPWSNALELLRTMLDSNVACLRISVKGAQPREYMFAAGPKVCPEALAEWEARNASELLPITLRPGEAVAITWSDSASLSTLPELLKRYDIAYSAAVQVWADNGVEYTLNLSRDLVTKPYSSDELAFIAKVGNHFGSALKLRQELLQARIVNELQSDTLDRLGIAAILVASRGDISMLNKTAEKMLADSDCLRLRGGRLHALYEPDNRLFQSILKEALGSKVNGQSRAMMIRKSNGDAQLNLLASVRKTVSLVSGRDENCVLIFVGRESVAAEADLKVLQELFSFTPAEAKLALGLAKGMPLEDVEMEMNIRHNTARAHLRSMFLKANVSKQAELVHRLANSLAPLGRPLDATPHADVPHANMRRTVSRTRC